MADDDMKRWLEEAAKVQASKGFSHARTKPIVVEKLKAQSRRPPDHSLMKKQDRDSEDGTPQ
jgi:hypothetical protein